MLTTPTDRQSPATEQSLLNAGSRVLLFASETISDRLALPLHEALGYEVVCAIDVARCEQLLRQEGFRVILLEDSVPCAQPSFSDTVYRHAGSALVLEVNFGVANVARILRAIKAAEERRRIESHSARAAVLHAMRSELSSALTGLMLESELALHSNRNELAPALSNLIALADLLYRQMRP